MRAPLVNVSSTKDCEVCVAAVEVCKSVITLRRGVRREQRLILDNVSAQFEPGTMSAVMGPSGAGKTTLLNMLRSGRCTSGAITLNGHSFPRRAARQLIKTIPQDDILLPGTRSEE